MRLLLTPLLLSSLAAAAPAGAQTVFRCVDGAGKVAFQGQPCGEGAKQSEVRVREAAPAASASKRESMWKGYTPPKVAAVTFYYDPTEEPVGFSSAQMEADVRAAIAAWSAGCNVRLSYGGRRPARRPGTPEHVSIRWAPEYLRMAHPADARSGIAGTGSLEDGIALKPRFQEAHMLSVLIHEMGHVLGLPHNHDDPGSVMSYLRDEGARRNPSPSAADFRDCNQSMQKMFGVDYQPSRDMPVPPAARSGARMSDREALEKIFGKPER
jgi:hypothetical protein